MKKILYSTFLIFLAILPQNSNADELDFYSRIDDAGDSLVQNLTKRELQEFSSFKNFATQCRDKAPWLDNAPMSQTLLDEIANGGFAELSTIAKQNNKNFSNDELLSLSNCLNSAYNKIKSSAITQKEIIEDSASIGIFMDGDLENSDFDIIEDINKINEIIFAKPAKYEWVKNPNKKTLADYLAGFKPIWLGKTAKEISEWDSNNQNNWWDSFLDINSNTENSTNQNLSNSSLTWENICIDNDSGKNLSDVNNMVDSRFLEDLNLALKGGKMANKWLDYSSKKNSNNSSPNSDTANNSWVSENNSDSSKDFATSLPCNDFYCIRIGSNIKNENLLIGGKGSNSIEWILDKHIETVNPISYTNLSAQKMTNNSFQLPFLNLKFKNMVAWGVVNIHNSPQISKISPTTAETLEMDFDKMQRCAWLESWLSTEFGKDNWVIGWGYSLNSAHHTENFANSTKPLNPIETAQIMDCNNAIVDSSENKYYEWFSTQVNELQAFTFAILDVIEQILHTEKKLDDVKVQ